jgi:agmatine deiminase
MRKPNPPKEGITPSSLGFYMPPEWQPHHATWLSWPHNLLTFPKSIIGEVEATYCAIIRALQGGEKVRLLVDGSAGEAHAREAMELNGTSTANIEFFRIRTADVWMRDYGPTFLLNRGSRRRGAVRWIFNAWGGKYDDLLADNEAGDEVAKAAASLEGGGWELEVFRPGIVMEGGSIDVDGEGALLTTEQCLLNPNRNPCLGKGQIEEYLRDFLGVSNVVWLKSGIDGDDTDGHVDDFCRFFGKGRAILSQEKGRADANFAALLQNRTILEENGIEAVVLPMPPPLYDGEEGRRLPASHANFYVGNQSVLMPAFGGESDAEAAGVLEGCFPGRKIVPIECRRLVYGYGGIHCITQQEPKI